MEIRDDFYVAKSLGEMGVETGDLFFDVRGYVLFCQKVVEFVDEGLVGDDDLEVDRVH